MREQLKKQSLLLYDFKVKTMKELAATKVFLFYQISEKIENYTLQKYQSLVSKVSIKKENNETDQLDSEKIINLEEESDIKLKKLVKELSDNNK